MSNSTFAIIEVSLIFGLVLAFGFYELRSLRREKEKDKAKSEAQK
jgi:hypothetical protein